MASSAIRQDRSYSYADYLQFPPGERWELIDGTAYNMTPAPSTEHQNICMELSGQIYAQLRGKPCKPFAAPIDVRFERNEGTAHVVQPDLIVVCDPAKIVVNGIVGAPDWIVEVISPGSAGRDEIAKRALYERFGVREYWLVHPVDRIVSIYRLAPSGAYAISDVHELQGKLGVSVLPGVEIDWDLWQPL